MTLRDGFRLGVGEGAGGRVEDSEDVHRLMDAREVAEFLRKPLKSVYGLPIPKIRLSLRCIRWRRADVLTFIESRRAVLDVNS